MVVISYAAISEFIKDYKNATDPCNNWYRLMELADISNFHELKRLFNSVDAVGNDRYVFNLGGNKFRLVAMIFFSIRTVFIRGVYTHREYDKIKDISAV